MNDNSEKEILTRLVVVETKISDYNEIKDTAVEANTLAKQNEKNILDLLDNNKFIIRTVVGTIISAVIGLIFVYIKLGLGVT